MAVPNPERELERLRKLTRGKGGPPRVMVISGAAEFFRSEAFDAILGVLPQSADLRRVDGSEAGDGQELDDLRGGSLFGSGTWVAVRRGDAWLKEHGPALLKVLEHIAPGCGLLLEAQKIDKRTKFGKKLASEAELFTFRELYAEPYDRNRSPLEAELVGWIVQRARQTGLRLSAEAAFLVMSMVGRDPSELVAEIGRLTTALGDAKGTISPELLRPHLSTSFESTPFEFADAVLAFDRARAERSLDAMFARGVKSRDGSTMDQGGVFPFVTSWLWQSMSSAHHGRALLDGGLPMGQVAGQVGVRTFVDRFVVQVQRNPEARLRRGLSLLMEAQRELRGTGEDPRWLLGRFLIRYFREDAA